MSASRPRSSESEQRAHYPINDPLAPELALRSFKEPPSTRLSNPNSTLPPSLGARRDSSRSEPRKPPSPTASPLSGPKLPSIVRSQSNDRSSIPSRGVSPSISVSNSSQENRQIIVNSFAPRVIVYASTDTEEFLGDKGFEDGLYSLLRPYGERLSCKVNIRDGIGGSRTWEDFGIRFVDSRQLLGANAYQAISQTLESEHNSISNGSHVSSNHNVLQTRDPGTAIDQVLEHCLKTEDKKPASHESEPLENNDEMCESASSFASLYSTYLRKLLSSASLVPYETFSHPVACMITVSSHHPAPIEALRQLYLSTGRGSNQAPAWVNTEYLRYYVLIHDEENDDITKSTALFDLMKRHFGLHCHLLRLRSSQCIETDDDSSMVPRCEWLSAEEEVDQIRAKGKVFHMKCQAVLICKDYTNEYEVSESYILESDATAIRALLREMVTQSIIPFMENRVTTWNDQVASRRRGISGRFMSLSKRWTGFGSTRNTTSGSGPAASSSGSNFDHQKGFYPPETPEATMRHLGDYALMLRDWRLAYSTYDFLRTEYSHDKAWSYHAAANEMAAITSLISTPTIGSKIRLENIDQMLDTAAYSYLTRCSMPRNAIRCLTLATELLQNRGPIAVDDTARWGGRLLEFGVLTPLAQALMAERLADCYHSRSKATLPFLGTRRRQAALWNVLASSSWLTLDKSAQAAVRLRAARKLYDFDQRPNDKPPFASMEPLWQKIDRTLSKVDNDASSTLIDLGTENSVASNIVEESEQLNVFNHPVYTSEPDSEGFTAQGAVRSDSTIFNDLQQSQDGFNNV